MLEFSLARIAQLIRIDCVIERKNIISTLATVIILLLLLELLSPGLAISGSTFHFFLYIIGLMLVNRIGRDFHDPHLMLRYFSLPCTSLERFLAKLILVTIGVVATCLVLFGIFSLLSFVLNDFIWGRIVPIFNFSSHQLWLANFQFVIIQSVFLLGATYFKRNSVTKTTLSIGCIVLLYLFLLLFTGAFGCAGCANFTVYIRFMQGVGMLPVLFWVILGPVCWLLTYWLIAHREM